MRILTIVSAAVLALAQARQAAAQGGNPAASPVPLSRLFSADTYTEYELLDPGTAQFRVKFMAEESPVGSAQFDWRAFEGQPLVETLQHGLERLATQAYDPRTGASLKVTYGPPGDRDAVRVAMPRAVPEGGIGRVLIYQVFGDPRSYLSQGPEIIWTRTISAYRVGVVLPKEFSVTSSNTAAQLTSGPDGRVRLAFVNPSGQTTSLAIHARRNGTGFQPLPFSDMFFDDVKTLYDLDAPETHTIRVEQRYSDFRKGDQARLDSLSYLPLRDLQVIDLDTAEPLAVTRVAGGMAAKLAVVVANDKQSAHLKLTGTVIDNGYKAESGALVFDRQLHGLRNTVLLPAGWDVAGVSQSATVGTYRGRAFVALVNLNGENSYRVTIQARRRPTGQ